MGDYTCYFYEEEGDDRDVAATGGNEVSRAEAADEAEEAVGETIITTRPVGAWRTIVPPKTTK